MGVCLAVCVLTSVLAADDGIPAASRVGVTVPRPATAVPAEEWGLLQALAAAPTILLLPGADAARTDLAAWRAEIAAYASHGLRPGVTPVPHLPGLAWAPEVDEEGVGRADRQNPFDPAFRAAWIAYLRAAAAGLREEPIGRFSVVPPSYYGEFEYYLGPDWAHPRFLCYSDLARARFDEWLAARYGTPSRAAEAWGLPEAASWADLPSPKPHRETSVPHLETAWLDLMEWRTDYLTGLVAEGLHAAGAERDGESAFLTAVGDYGAAWGTDTAALARACRDLPPVTLHHTNGHSLADTRYVCAVARRYGLAAVVTENDGNRAGRGEIAKLTLVALLAGVDEYNYSFDAHLLDRAEPAAATDAARALADAATLLRRYRTRPAPSEIVFLHSNTAAWARPPEYRNRDVSHVYDEVLANADRPDAVGFSWARWLAMPDVTGERLVADGDLEGRRMVVLPSTGPTLLRAEAADALRDWVERGGTFVAFGDDPLGLPLQPAGSGARLMPSPEPALPPVGPSEGSLEARAPALASLTPLLRECPTAPVWLEPLPEGWETLVADARGRAALAQRPMGRGRLVRCAGRVAADASAEFGAFHRLMAPALLRALARESGCTLPYELTADEAPAGETPPLALGDRGIDPATGRRLFVAGAPSVGCGPLTLRVDPSLAGPCELLLVDVRDARAPGATVAPATPLDRLYRDPTNQPLGQGALLPSVRIEFDGARPLRFSLVAP